MNQSLNMPGEEDLPHQIAFKSQDLDELGYFLDSGGVLEKRKLTPVGNFSRINAEISSTNLQQLDLIGVRLGANMIARSVPLSVAQIVIPIQGKIIDWTNGDALVAQCGRSAIVHMPDRPVKVEWEADTRALVVRIPAKYLAGVYSSITQQDLSQQTQLQAHLNLCDESGQSLLSIIRKINSLINSDKHSTQDTGLIAVLEELLVTTLITAETGVSRLCSVSKNTKPVYSYVRRASNYIDEHIEESISLVELTSTVDVSLRTLQNGFRMSYGISPMAFVRRKKLDCVYKELSSLSPSQVKIADIAAKWGFTHASHFSRIYKAQFDQLPSETLREASANPRL